MDDIAKSLAAETDRLLLKRTGVMSTVVLLGMTAGLLFDLLLGRLAEHPYRVLLVLGGMVGMSAIIRACRQPHYLPYARVFAFVVTTIVSAFLVALSADAGPETETVMMIAFTVLVLATGILFPWGPGWQLGSCCVNAAGAHISMWSLGMTTAIDPSVLVAFTTGLGLSLFVSSNLERMRLTLARQRRELAIEKERAEDERRSAEMQKSKAEALASDLDAYAHAVAHDLKNPLNAVMGYADLLRGELDGSLDDESSQFLDRVVGGAEKMTQIINELLLLASVRKSGAVPQQALDMAATVGEVRERMAGICEEAGAKIEVPSTWPQAIGHGPWVEEVWVNYVSNAIKYGGDPPRVELGADPPHDGFVHFWVRDNGRGLAAEETDQLFREFSRVDTRSADGHGLGLSIVKRIVERLGGCVTVSSQAGSGSTFGFTLPSAEGFSGHLTPTPKRLIKVGQPVAVGGPGDAICSDARRESDAGQSSLRRQLRSQRASSATRVDP